MSAASEWNGRGWMLLINCIPALHLIGIACLLFNPWADGIWRVGAALMLLYLMPPLLARAILRARPIEEGTIFAGKRGFLTWWTLFQLQVVFCRLPVLEELLRFVPGLYSQWLRLWGAKIGRFTYWSAGVQITDRSFLRIGNDVVLGAAVRLNPHVLTKDQNGLPQLILGTVRIGDRVMVGGYSLLTAGTELSDDEAGRAFLISPPFSTWKDGKRVR